MDVIDFCNRYYTERRGTSSLKWDALDERFGNPDLISMWVADMEFQTPECVTESLKQRVEHGVFGYSAVPDSYYQAVADWEETHHGYKPEREWMRISPGVVAALYWAVNMYTKKDDAVIILTPVYYPFHNCVKDSGRKLITCDLVYDKGNFTVDFDAFERAIVENKVKLYILCSPHNPVGRVWTEDELVQMLTICERHHVLVLSDEIHQDLVFCENRHIPSAAVAGGRYAQNIITAIASSKTFNLATCLTATIIIENKDLRRIWDEFINIYYQVEVNVFGITAVEAALRGGQHWYEDLKKVIYFNYQLLVEAMKEFPNVYIAPLEGTYLVLIDLREYVPLDKIKEFIQDNCHLAVDYGEWFGENWEGFIRLNIGTHPDIVKQAVKNIKDNLHLIASRLEER
ncbi:MAG: MalY/PatB family protein [Lachnospiraceae bacterium]